MNGEEQPGEAQPGLERPETDRPETDRPDADRQGMGLRGAADRTPAHFRRLHPVTPLLRGWAWLAAAIVFGGQNAVVSGDPRRFAVIIPVVAVLGFGFGFASWWFTRYGFDGDDLRIDSGVFQRRSRRVRMDRLQAVDIVRPLAGRLLGVSELRMEVAGGGESEAPLAYLSVDDAVRLRAELLARSAGIAADTPEAPERQVHEVQLDRLIGSTVLSGAFMFGVAVFVAIAVVVATGSGQIVIAGMSGFIPGLFAVGAALWYQLGRNFGFTLAESPDGFRIRKGLLDTRSQTVPPGRIQGVALRQPLLWRVKDWVKVDVDVAGYAGSSSSPQTSTLLPVATYHEAISVLRQVLPGADPASVPLERVPRRAAWLRPIGWFRLAYGADDRVIVAREGVFYRSLMIVPHAKTQSVRLTQGPIQRRLKLASVAVDTTPGPVDAVIRHRPELQARDILEAQARRARLARRVDVPERWMVAPGGDEEVGNGDPPAAIADGRGDSVPPRFEEQDSPGHGDSG
ncbi:MAG TPA: PH domain-containing protein [Jiangellaceae bacterium]